MVPCERRTQGWGHSKNYTCHALSLLQVWSVHSWFSKLDYHPVSPRMPELILKLGLLRMQNHQIKVGFFWLLKRLNYFFGQLQLYDSGVAFWTMHQGQHGHCDSATKDWVLNHGMRPRPDSGQGAYAGAHRRVVLGRTASWSPKS